jgi:AhpD family alkylhydroperoxidase
MNAPTNRLPNTKRLALPLVALGALMLGTPAPASANAEVEATLADIKNETGGFVPSFLKALPDTSLPGAWAEMKGLWASSDTALPCKIKDLIGVAVASQIPSKAQVDGHMMLAKASGATAAEIAEGVTMAALARHWSTFFNGAQLDPTKFRTEIGKVVQRAKAAAAAGGPPPAAGKPIEEVDARTAMEEMKQTFGFVPDFASRFPAAALAGAWRQMRDVELNPKTALSGKYKSLIGLAVSSQIPCQYCVFADTEFAKLEGATEQEIVEAVAMAGLVRTWSAFLTGLSVDEAMFRKDLSRIARHVAKMRAGAAATPVRRSSAVASATQR